VTTVIKNLNPKKAPDYDFITNKVLQKMPEIKIKFIAQLCNAQTGLFSIPMEGSANYYDPEIWQICRTSRIDRLICYLSYRNYLRNFYSQGFSQ